MVKLTRFSGIAILALLTASCSDSDVGDGDAIHEAGPGIDGQKAVGTRSLLAEPDPRLYPARTEELITLFLGYPNAMRKRNP